MKLQPSEESNAFTKNAHLPGLTVAGRAGLAPAAGLLLVALTVTAYLPVTQCGYIWDDDAYVHDNPTLRSAEGLRQIWFRIGATPQYYPLVHTSYWLEYRLWNLNPAGYHVVNILLHAVGAVLLWRLLTRLKVPGAWAAAAIFALHPVHVESVAWITERKNVLSGVCYLGAALAYLRYALGSGEQAGRTGSGAFYLVALVLFLCALLSKTVTCSLPAALLLVLWWKGKRIGQREVCALVPFFALGMALGLLTAWMEKHHVGAMGEEWDFSLVDRCLIAGRALWFYAGKLCWPHPLTFIYPRWQIDAGIWWQYAFPAAALAVVTTLWFTRYRLGRGPLTAVLFFAGTLMPALGFFDVFPMRYSFVADHFQYLASVGLILLVTAAVCRLAHRLGPWGVRSAICMAVVVLAALGALTWRQGQVYGDEETLWRDTLRKNPNAWMAHNNLGNLLQPQGKAHEAIEHYHLALQLHPNDAAVYSNLGLALLDEGKLKESLRHLHRALQIEPDLHTAHTNLGIALAREGQRDKAIIHFRRALEIKPNLPKTHSNLGNVLLAQGKTEKAIARYRRALQIAPDFAEARYNLGIALSSQDKMTEAIRCYQQALQAMPNDARVHCSLGIAMSGEGHFNESVDYFRRALQLKPDLAEAHNNLGKVLALTGRPAEAATHFREALRMKPDRPTPLNDLAWLLATCTDAGVRDASEAVELAERACELTKHQNAGILDTLAAAYAEAGDFAKAVTTAQAAITLVAVAQESELAEGIRQRLELYRQKKPYREPARPPTTSVPPTPDVQ